MENKASLTALLSAFGRAYHMEYDAAPIFQDSLAGKLLTQEEMRQMEGYLLAGMDFFDPEEKQNFSGEEEALRWVVHTQLAPTPLARARYCEEMLANGVRTGTEQYVMLGAGMDTFAYRNSYSRMQVYEVDHPLTQEDKRRRVKAAGLEVPGNLTYVPIDFQTEDLAEKLEAAGFDRNKKTFFSWLGVTYYLTKKENEKMVKTIASLVPKGSTLLFDCAGKTLFDSPVPRVRRMTAMAEAGGEPMKSGYSYRELEEMLERQGFLIYEFLTPEEIQNRFFSGRADKLRAFEEVNYVLAVCR